MDQLKKNISGNILNLIQNILWILDFQRVLSIFDGHDVYDAREGLVRKTTMNVTVAEQGCRQPKILGCS